MSEKIRVFHATSGLVGRRVAEKRTDIYHAYRIELITANIAVQMRDATAHLPHDGVVLEYLMPKLELVQVDHDGWFTPKKILSKENWNLIPVKYRVEMFNAGLLVEGTLNDPLMWPTNIEVSVLSGEFFNAIHAYASAMLSSMNEAQSP